MRNRSPVGIVAFALVVTSRRPASASAHELSGGPSVVGALSLGGSTGIAGGGGLGGTFGYGFTDVVRLYAQASYDLGAPPFARHEALFGAGVSVAFDALAVVPWGGLGVGGLVVSAPGAFIASPTVEARIGLDYLASRTLGATFQLAYCYPVLARRELDGVFSFTAGLRFTAFP